MAEHMRTGQIVNTSLDLSDLDKPQYSRIVSEINKLRSCLRAKGLRHTTYQAEFDTGWGKDDIWFKRKCWEMAHATLNTGVQAGHTVLDCGGASSIFSYYLASRGCITHTVDIDWRGYGIVENANAVARAMGWQMDNLDCDMSRMPYLDETFDRIFSICVLEHLEPQVQEEAIKEISRVLKRGGVAALTFDYGPGAPNTKYTDVSQLNERIVRPSALEIFGNRDFQESPWFTEQFCASWGALFLQKPKTATTGELGLLTCSAPQSRSVSRRFMSNVGLRRGNTLIRIGRFLSLLCRGRIGHITGAVQCAIRNSH